MTGFTFERALKILVFAALVLTAWKGLGRTPEFASHVAPQRFFTGLVNDAENSLIMKERHLDFNDASAKAVRVRLEEFLSQGRTPDPSMINEESLRRAVNRRLAVRERDADYVVMAREKLERVRAMEREGWRMDLGVVRTPAEPAAPRTTGKDGGS